MHGNDLLKVAEETQNPHLAAAAIPYFVASNNPDAALHAISRANAYSKARTRKNHFPPAMSVGVYKNFQQIRDALIGLMDEPNISGALDQLHRSSRRGRNPAQRALLRELNRVKKAVRTQASLRFKYEQKITSYEDAGQPKEAREWRVKLRDLLADTQVEVQKAASASLFSDKLLEGSMSRVHSKFADLLREFEIKPGPALAITDSIIGKRKGLNVLGHHAFLLHSLHLLRNALPPGGP